MSRNSPRSRSRSCDVQALTSDPFIGTFVGASETFVGPYEAKRIRIFSIQRKSSQNVVLCRTRRKNCGVGTRESNRIFFFVSSPFACCAELKRESPANTYEQVERMRDTRREPPPSPPPPPPVGSGGAGTELSFSTPFRRSDSRLNRIRENFHSHDPLSSQANRIGEN